MIQHGKWIKEGKGNKLTHADIDLFLFLENKLKYGNKLNTVFCLAIFFVSSSLFVLYFINSLVFLKYKF